MAAALAYRNLVPSAIAGVVTLGGSATSTQSIDAGLPAWAATDPDPSVVTGVGYTRNATAAADLEMHATWPAASTVRVVAALNVALPANVVHVQMRVREGLVIRETTSIIAAADLVPIEDQPGRYDLFWLLAEDRVCDKVELLIRTPASGKGSYQVGVLWASPALVFPDGVDAKWEQGYVDGSDVERGDGGGFSAFSRPVRRVLTAPLSARDYATALGTAGNPAAPSLRKLAHLAGRGRPVIALQRTSDVHAIQTTSVYGLFRDLAGVGHQAGPYYSSSFTVEQIR